MKPKDGRPWFKFVIVLYAITVLGLVGSYIWIATLDIQVSAYVQAPKELIAGRSHAVRGFFLNAATGRMFGAVEADFSSGEFQWGKGTTGGHGYLQTQITPSDEGEHVLRLKAKHPYFEEDYVVDTAVEVRSPGQDDSSFPTSEDPAARVLWMQDRLERAVSKTEIPKLSSRLPEDKRDWKKESNFTGELVVDVLPKHAELVRGLPNAVFLRVTSRSTGRPVRANITLEKTEGLTNQPLKKSYKTDELGLTRIEVEPAGSLRWTVKAESLEPRADGADVDVRDTGQGTVFFVSVPAQFSLKMRRNWVVPGTEAEGVIHTLYRNGGFMVDLYDGARWVDAGAFGINAVGGGLTTKIPSIPSSAVLRVQVYESVFDPGTAWDSRYVAVLDSATTEACWRGLRRILTLSSTDWARFSSLHVRGLRSGKLEVCNQWLEAALLTLPTHFEPAPLLVNSQQAERIALEEWKDEVKSDLLLITIFSLLVGLAGLFLLVKSSIQANIRQRVAMRLVELEMDDDIAEDSLAERLGRYSTIARAIVLLGTIIMFFAGLIMVLTLL